MAPIAVTATAIGSPVRHVQSAGMEYGYPHGHLGRLTETEANLFAQFKALVEEKGLYVSGPRPSHDEPTLLRYLRARKWVVQDAYKQFKDTEDWRAAVDIDVLYKTVDVEAYEMARRLYPEWTGRRDKRGIPLYVYQIRNLDTKAIHAYERAADTTYSEVRPESKEALSKTSKGLVRLFALYENLTRFAQPLASQMTDRENADVPITLSTNIVDVHGVSLKQFWNLKAHMQAASVLATSHYPETLDRIFVIGAPSFFHTVWGWIKRWFDPVTVSKIFILSPHEVFPVLSRFVDPKNIPKRYGGELELTSGARPPLDPAVKEAVTWCGDYTDFPPGPVFWRDVDDETLECVAVGSIDKVVRMDRVCTMKRVCKYHPAPGDQAPATRIGAERVPTAGANNVALVETTEGRKISQGSSETDEKIAAATKPLASPPRGVHAA